MKMHSEMPLGYLALVVAASVLCVLVPECAADASPTGEPPKSAGLMRDIRTRVLEFSKEAHEYVVSVVGTQAIDKSLECVQGVIRVLSEGAASGLNVVAVYVSEIFKAAGIPIKLPFHRITPEGVAFVAQWALVAVIGYWLLSLLLRLVGSVVRRILWLLKLGVALWLFSLIVGDTEAGVETTALRLAGLVCACVLMGMGGASDRNRDSAHLEKRIRSLEAKLRTVERKKEE
ncbi:voltage-gated monoatomic cation channel TMEM109 [Anguilla rostrata]|uniref:voltage-gated monoatomic cation channel TMEM109 n=1 Tax=Anguilla rostrata TaxID=7938 RepID=UPI0030D0C8F8